ncbi:DUF742 domain-containing protein [Actinomadura sp. DC4]|uniref:DUF742 domain-containing protein n=1 Tax=Actinomadura sp. DC4 TaxID=3055069 RepID=UPI0025B1707D|nr:DUF742 domain-containing protein [Actinomadura sp. DC4]MDN3354426.1 DUF742 domain-containing protein [Actinomadura sp. DC4]
MEVPRERWVGRDAGPVVRPYAMTRGRTGSGDAKLDLITILVATGRESNDFIRLSREQRRLLELCGRPTTVADLASEVDLPLRVVQVLLGDLLQQDRIEEVPQALLTERPDPRILMRVLDDLRRL